MAFLNFRRTKDSAQLTPAIYVALVDSLFQNFMASFAGTICAAIAAVLTAWKTGVNLLWPCALLIIAVGAVRTLDMRAYETQGKPLTPQTAPEWERRYRIGAALYAGALGLWCWVALMFSDDAIAHLLCLSVTIGYIAAGAGRNYGRPPIAYLQVVCALGPMCLGLLLSGDIYYVALGLLNTLFFISLKRITLDLHQVHVRALIAGETISSIANQFDTALNNMPNGLCMFGPDGRLAVVNRRFTEMMNLGHDDVLLGVGMRELLAAGVAAKAISDTSADAIACQIEYAQESEVITCDNGIAADRALEWTFQPMDGGGIVMLVEDVTERRNAQAKISRMARFDDLTGLPNRQSFRDEIAGYLGAERGGEMSALLFIDLDQFKQVNDTLGHPAGDLVLRGVSGVVTSLLQPGDVFARYGGEEFAVLMRSVDLPAAVGLAERLRQGIEAAVFDTDGASARVTISLGVASLLLLADPDGRVLLAAADEALYRAKRNGRNRVES